MYECPHCHGEKTVHCPSRALQQNPRLDAMVQENGLWDFIPATAKNAQGRERALVLSAAGPALFQDRHNQTAPGPRRPTGPNGGVADSLDEAKAASRAAGSGRYWAQDSPNETLWNVRRDKIGHQNSIMSFAMNTWPEKCFLISSTWRT
jgi:hypothetical protein